MDRQEKFEIRKEILENISENFGEELREAESSTAKKIKKVDLSEELRELCEKVGLRPPSTFKTLRNWIQNIKDIQSQFIERDEKIEKKEAPRNEKNETKEIVNDKKKRKKKRKRKKRKRKVKQKAKEKTGIYEEHEEEEDDFQPKIPKGPIFDINKLDEILIFFEQVKHLQPQLEALKANLEGSVSSNRRRRIRDRNIVDDDDSIDSNDTDPRNETSDEGYRDLHDGEQSNYSQDRTESLEYRSETTHSIVSESEYVQREWGSRKSIPILDEKEDEDKLTPLNTVTHCSNNPIPFSHISHRVPSLPLSQPQPSHSHAPHPPSSSNHHHNHHNHISTTTLAPNPLLLTNNIVQNLNNNINHNNNGNVIQYPNVSNNEDNYSLKPPPKRNEMADTNGNGGSGSLVSSRRGSIETASERELIQQPQSVRDETLGFQRRFALTTTISRPEIIPEYLTEEGEKFRSLGITCSECNLNRFSFPVIESSMGLNLTVLHLDWEYKEKIALDFEKVDVIIHLESYEYTTTRTQCQKLLVDDIFFLLEQSTKSNVKRLVVPVCCWGDGSPEVTNFRNQYGFYEVCRKMLEELCHFYAQRYNIEIVLALTQAENINELKTRDTQNFLIKCAAQSLGGHKFVQIQERKREPVGHQI